MNERESFVSLTEGMLGESSDFDLMVQLLRDWPLCPYRNYAPELDSGLYEAFCESYIRAVLLNQHSRVILRRSATKLTSAACWTYLPWDTEQLGVSTARLELLLSGGTPEMASENNVAILKAVLDQCHSVGIRYLTARIHACDLQAIHALEANGFVVIDGIQTFSLKLQPSDEWPVARNCRVRLFEPQDLQWLLSIARSSYAFDRFHMDTFLSKECADKLNERWVENSCIGTAADAVIVALVGERPVGYVTCKIDHQSATKLGVMFGSIGMVATDVELRGRGIARAATNGALEWFRDQKVNVVEVGTQLCNIAAGRLYEQCGFRLISNSLTFRKLL